MIYIYMYVGLSMGNPYKKYVCQICVIGMMWLKDAHAQSQFWAVKTELKANRASETEEQRKGDDNE